MITFAEPLMLAAGILSLPGVYLALTRDSKFKQVVWGTKTVTVLLLAAALASPSITVQEQRMQQPEAVVLQDNSRSTQVIDDTSLEFDDVRTVERTVASGNSSDLRSGILQNVDEDQAYLLRSDLQSSSSLEGVAEEIQQRNATVHVLKPEAETEAAVTIEGPDTTYPGAENTFSVRVSSTGETPEPDVTLNGESVELEQANDNEWRFTETFDEEGFNSIQASIDVNDHFEDNNEYYQTVEVAEKPEVLVLGEEGRIGQEFSRFYSFDYRDSIPEDLSDYYTVIAKEQFDESQLASYTAEGNGLIYTGGYEENNQLLPVRDAPYEDQSINMMLLIDASQGGNPEERLQRTKRIAYMLLDSDALPPGSKVGALYYNDAPHLISEPRILGENNHREKLQGGIANIPVGGNSLHDEAIESGQNVIDGEGNLLLISDGEITELGEFHNVTTDSRELAESSEERIISIMVGQNPNRGYLEEVASLSGGYSISDVESQELSFQGGGASGDAVSLLKNDDSHFITQGLEVEGTTSGFDGVELKRGAKQLVSGTNSQPFLSSWRYGIGRVAAFSGGEKDLGAVMYRDSEMVSRTLSWAVGEPQRKEERRLDVEDGQVGEQVEAEASYQIEGLNRQGENLYTGTLDVETPGIHSFNDHLYSYNYNDEVEEVGYNSIEEFAQETGGQVFTPDQEDQIAEEIKSFSNEKVEKEKDLTDFFLAAALLVFLSEIGYRKRRGKK